MIIFSGLGILIVVVLIVSGMSFSSGHSGGLRDMDFAYSCLVTGVFSALVGWFLRKNGRVVIDKATGREMVLRRRHSLFFIPMFYWGPIFFLGGLYLVIKHAFFH